MYELIVIAKAGNGDSVFSKVEKIVKEVKATEIKTKKMGKKNLAYPIMKQTEADYFLFNFEADGGAIIEISQNLKLEQEDILRYLILKTKYGFSEMGKEVLSEKPEVASDKSTETVKVEVKAKPKLKPRSKSKSEVIKATSLKATTKAKPKVTKTKSNKTTSKAKKTDEKKTKGK